MNNSIQVEYLLETIIDSMKNDTRTSKNDNRAKRGKECVINCSSCDCCRLQPFWDCEAVVLEPCSAQRTRSLCYFCSYDNMSILCRKSENGHLTSRQAQCFCQDNWDFRCSCRMLQIYHENLHVYQFESFLCICCLWAQFYKMRQCWNHNENDNETITNFLHNVSMWWMVHVGPCRIDLHQKFFRILRSILSYKLAQKRSIPASLHEEVNTQFPFLVPLRGKKFHQACIAKDMKVEDNTWRKGYWMNPTWRQGPLEAGQANEILRKYRTWLNRFRGQLPAVKT